MNSRVFGETGREVPVIGYGTWNLEKVPQNAAIDAILAAVDSGATHIDTAEMYGDGVVESVVGRAIAGRWDDLFLVSKVLPGNATRDGVVEACERSLRRLRTDVLDCYLLHWRGRVPLSETLEGFRRLRDRGLIRSWGVSNFDVDDLEEIAALAGAESIACNQVLYHLEERAIEHRVAPWCRDRGVAVVAYSPFGSGAFPREGTDGRAVLERIAEERGATSRQIALAFLTREEPLFAIPMSGSPDHVRENSGAGSISLGSDEIEQIAGAFPLRPRDTLPVL